MRRTAGKLTASLAVVAGLAAPPAESYTRPASVQLVSVAEDGTLANNGAANMAMTPDGRYVAFASESTNLVAGDTNSATDVFVRDVQARITTRVSVDSAGRQGVAIGTGCTNGTHTKYSTVGLGGASSPTISADGRYVVFLSCFVNLVTPTALFAQVYRHDRRTGRTVLVSVNDDGAAANSGHIGPPSVSADGRYVVFASTATNLTAKSCTGNAAQQAVCGTAAGGLLGATDWKVYRRDMMTGKTTLVSVDSRALAGNGNSYAPFVSADGRYAGFLSTSDNLTNEAANPTCYSGQLPACPQLYLHDMTSGRTTLVSVGIGGLAGNGPASSSPPIAFEGEASPASISANNRYVVFSSTATDLTPQGPFFSSNGTYVRDLVTGRTEMVSVTSSGDFPGANGDVAQTGFGSYYPSISPDGRYVNFTVGCPNWYGQTGVFVHDRLTGASEFAVPSLWGTPTSCANHGSSTSTSPRAPNNRLTLGADGRWAAFGGVPGAFLKGSYEGNDAAGNQIMLANRGPSLGVGGLAGTGRLTVEGAPGFATSGLVSARATRVSGTDGVDAIGGRLALAALAYRSRSRDLFLRLDVQTMPSFAQASPTMVYGVDLTVNGTRFQVRAAKSGVRAVFNLYRLAHGAWQHVGALAGGYGTTGQAVVVALPLADIAADQGGRITQATAFTALGSFGSSALRVLDRIVLAGDPFGRGRQTGTTGLFPGSLHTGML